MTVGDGPARVRRLVESLLTAAGVPFEWHEGCLQANLSAEAMTALEAHWSPPATLLLTFDAAAAARHPEADLVAPGSFRLERFLAWIRREVHLSQAFLPPLPRGTGRRLLAQHLASSGGGVPGYYLLDEGQAWEPYLVVAFVAARIGEERRETLHVPGINLVTGEVQPQLLAYLPQEAGEPCGPQVRRRLAYRRAYRALLDAVVTALHAEDPAWAHAALQRYEEEVRRLEAYYGELARENRGNSEALAQLEANRQRRLHEQKDRFRPRVLVRPSAAALLHVPVVTLSLLLCDGLRERRRTLTYDPLLGTFRPDATPPPLRPAPLPRTPPNRPPEPALPQPPGALRWPW